jgi:tRNA-specific 2-thiouridylase
MDKNIVYVSRNLNALALWQKEIELRDVVLRNNDNGHDIEARIRHRAPLVKADYDATTGKLSFAEEQKSLTPGQSVVFYRGDACIGGGIIK